MTDTNSSRFHESVFDEVARIKRTLFSPPPDGSNVVKSLRTRNRWQAGDFYLDIVTNRKVPKREQIRVTGVYDAVCRLKEWISAHNGFRPPKAFIKVGCYRSAFVNPKTFRVYTMPNGKDISDDPVFDCDEYIKDRKAHDALVKKSDDLIFEYVRKTAPIMADVVKAALGACQKGTLPSNMQAVFSQLTMLSESHDDAHRAVLDSDGVKLEWYIPGTPSYEKSYVKISMHHRENSLLRVAFNIQSLRGSIDASALTDKDKKECRDSMNAIKERVGISTAIHAAAFAALNAVTKHQGHVLPLKLFVAAKLKEEEKRIEGNGK
jgi:hypothetical protein